MLNISLFFLEKIFIPKYASAVIIISFNIKCQGSSFENHLIATPGQDVVYLAIEFISRSILAFMTYILEM